MTKANSKSARKALKAKQPKNKNTNAPAVHVEAEVETNAAPEPVVDDLDAVFATMDQEAADTSGSLITGQDAEVHELDKAEVYATQESDLTVAPEKQEKHRRQKSKKAEAGAPTVGRRKIDVTKLASILGTQEAADELVGNIATLPKKVQDKATNALSSITSGGQLSTYTKATVKKLVETGEVTVKDISGMMMSEGKYTPRTAASQSQQQMRVLSFLGVANRAGNRLTYNAEHPLAQALAA